MKVTARKLRDVHYGTQWFDQVLDRWDYDQFKADPTWREGWVSFDSLYHHPADDRVYLGVTSFAADIFHAWDRRQQCFVDLGYARVADPFDAKFHRSLVHWPADGCLYGAIALLHDVDRYWEAPGGAIVRYEPASGRLEKIAVPLPHLYIQSICLDAERGVLYGFTFTPERLFAFDLRTGTTLDLGPIGSALAMAQGENIELDAQGRAWFSWGATRAWQSEPGVDSCRLAWLDPDTRRIAFLDAGLPWPDGRYGYAKVEGLFSLGRDHLYASGANGSLYRLDPDTGAGTFVGTPVADRRSRLASLRLGPDGCAYGVTGRDGQCEVLRFDPRHDTWQLLGPVTDGAEACWQVHDVAITPDGVLYAGENDNPYRSGYLWEIQL